VRVYELSGTQFGSASESSHCLALYKFESLPRLHSLAYSYVLVHQRITRRISCIFIFFVLGTISLKCSRPHAERQSLAARRQGAHKIMSGDLRPSSTGRLRLRSELCRHVILAKFSETTCGPGEYRPTNNMTFIFNFLNSLRSGVNY